MNKDGTTAVDTFSVPAFDLNDYLAVQRSKIDSALLTSIQRLCPSDHMQPAVMHAVTAGGKRLRPVLCLASCSAVGGNETQAMPAACALEMIHTYSLIHDDLPALDNDDLRRGQPTCHVRFGEATAILAGDALLTMAFEVMSEAALQADGQLLPAWTAVMAAISRAAGCRGMIEGQARDLAFEGVKIGRDDLAALHRLKTGALIQAATRSGALLGGGSAQQVTQLAEYADCIGLAFQVVDDLLNVKGDPAVMGKAVGSDQARQKNTYPALLGLSGAEAYARALVEQGLQALSIFDNKADPLRAIAGYIIDRDH
ncbi:polyprenyl synthetase family protein [Desulfatitalea alkaliphila]|uniref:Polyprenyl synthetase family protein n=1 Tax=Desulfatitalea alkaliphila TaxID=2929485 RepID=A0AA41R757_9BACT|nr:farnesyl diphosphate synthase [Desulfatitalea alkaliphila]MCJ8502495.1 polyprenyl synthetase family protein [Desulfatitalea alkaliphila]